MRHGFAVIVAALWIGSLVAVYKVGYSTGFNYGDANGVNWAREQIFGTKEKAGTK